MMTKRMQLRRRKEVGKIKIQDGERGAEEKGVKGQKENRATTL